MEERDEENVSGGSSRKRTNKLSKLFGSQGRIDLVEALVRSGHFPKTAGELAKEAGIAQSTVSRNIQTLLDLKIIRRVDQDSWPAQYILNTENRLTQHLVEFVESLENKESNRAQDNQELHLSADPGIKQGEHTHLKCHYDGVISEMTRSHLTKEVYNAILNIESQTFTKSQVADILERSLSSLAANRSFDRLKRWAVVYGVPKASRPDQEFIIKNPATISFVETQFNTHPYHNLGALSEYIHFYNCDDDGPVLWDKELQFDPKEAITYSNIREYIHIKNPRVIFKEFGPIADEEWNRTPGYQARIQIKGSAISIENKNTFLKSIKESLVQMIVAGYFDPSSGDSTQFEYANKNVRRDIATAVEEQIQTDLEEAPIEVSVSFPPNTWY